MVKQIQSQQAKAVIARAILADLEEWFGIEEYTKDYIEKSKAMPFYAKFFKEQPVGFVSLKETSKYTCELFCMGVLRAHHHLGFGEELYKAIEEYAVKEGYKFIQVKTVKQGTYDTYDLTNKFYQSMGFYEFEVFDTLWDKHNPCQVFVKALGMTYQK